MVFDANTASPQIWWVTNDHLRWPVQMTDWSKTVVWRANHRPFGEVTAVTGTARLDARFPGQWFQLESGLAYNWHRHYDASLGRYTQPDPLGVKAGPSVYGYAGGNPVMGVDPEGLDQLVCLYPDAASGAGHVGFGDPKNNYTEGFYPKNGGLSGPGEIRRDEYDSKECKTVKSDPDQDECMQSCKEERRSNSGMYSLTGRQCTSFVRSCMSKCGLKTDGYDGPRLKRFFRGF